MVSEMDSNVLVSVFKTAIVLACFTFVSATPETCNCNTTVVIGRRLESGGVNVTVKLSKEQTRKLFNELGQNLRDDHVDSFSDCLISPGQSPDLAKRPRDCGDIQMLGITSTGVYTIYPGGQQAVRTRCDMDTASGGWTVIQRRVSDTDFYKTWAEYQVGFGNLSDSFWLGNENIHLITKQGTYKLRINMMNDNNVRRYAEYSAFSIGTEEDKYRLNVSGYRGDAGDSLTIHSGYRFSAKDLDNDSSPAENCATLFMGAWWYLNCHTSNLNGDYGNSLFGKGINWKSFTGFYSSLVSVSMLVKRFPA